MYRYTRKNELTDTDKLDILAGYSSRYRIIWKSMNRQLQKMGFKSHWELQILIMNKWDSVGELITCPHCGEILVWIEGNEVDDGYCIFCGKEIE